MLNLIQSIMKTKYLFIPLLFFIGQLTFPQTKISGKIDHYNGKANDILINPIFPESIGEINAAGEFTATLGEGYFKRLKKQMEENKQNPMSFSTLKNFQTRYQCGDDTFSFTNEDEPYVQLLSRVGFIVGDLKTSNVAGLIRVVSSSEFGKSQFYNPQNDPVKGYMLDWYYVEKSAKVDGKCTTRMSTGNGEETYQQEVIINLNFHPGWNLVKYEIAKVYTAKDGKKYTQIMRYSSIAEIPEDANYIYLAK